VLSLPVLLSFGLLGQAGTRFVSSAPLPGLPAIITDSAINYVGPARTVCEKYGLQGRVLWIDCTANIERYNTEEKIEALCERIRTAGFNTIVFDVKPLSGETVYSSAYAPKLKEWKGKILGDFDPAGIMVREAKLNGLNIFFSMNSFCDGHRLVNRGPGFARPEEQSVVYEALPVLKFGLETMDYSAVTISATLPVFKEGESGVSVVCTKQGIMIEGAVPKGGYVISATGENAEKLKRLFLLGGKVEFDSVTKFSRIGESGDKQYPLMTSPTNPTVRKRLMNMATEMMSKYNPDGLIYDDRLRYTGLNGDFSDSTRSAFDAIVGSKVNYPDDVFKYTYSYNNSLVRGVRPGKYYDTWMSWRASVLTNFAKEARETIRKVKPNAKLGVYAGSWYGDYQQYGNNWAANTAETGFWFATPEYQKTGMASNLDFLITGCYYNTATIYDAMGEGKGIGNSVEAAGNISYRAAHDQTFVYAGLSLIDFKDNPVGLGNALQAACATTNGVMVFDLSHDIEPMWPVFEKAFSVKKRAPHSDVRFLMEARRTRELLNIRGVKEPSIVIAAGSAGIGF
jgi:hypothetical protein